MDRSRALWRWAFPVGFLAVLVSISPRAASPQQQEALPHLTPDEVRLYQQARTVMDWTSDEIRLRPELQDLQPPESQRDLPMILQKAGERVAILFEKLPDITSTEEVRWHARFVEPQSISTGTSRRYFRYLLLVRPGPQGPVLEEHRTSMAEEYPLTPADVPVGPSGSAVDFDQLDHAPMMASRLLTTMLIFLPQKQGTCRFRYLGRQMLGERDSLVVGFAQIPEASPPVSVFRIPNGILELLVDRPDTNVLRIPGESVDVLVQGSAWFDATSYDILRIQTDLLAPRTELGLSKATVRIDFRAIHLEPLQLARRGEIPASIQLPIRAIVDATMFDQHLRNVQDYSDFKVYRVESRIVPVAPTEMETASGPIRSEAIAPEPPSLDSWYVPLHIMYRKSQNPSEMLRTDDRKRLASLGFAGEQIDAMVAAGQRMDGELREIDVKRKAIVDAQRAANPPPGLLAFRREFDARLEKEVSDIKVSLGPDLSARLDEYVRTHYVKVPAHSPDHASTTDLDLQIKGLEGYASLLLFMNANDRIGATDLEELEDRDEDAARLRNQIRANLGFTEEQFGPIRAAALRWEAEWKELFTREKPMREAYRRTLYAPPELKALNQQREDTIESEVSNLRRTLGPDLCAKLDAYFRVHYGL